MVLGNINIHVQNPDFLFMVEYAIKAPSGHNTQPWLFRINENNIEIHPNFDRALPVVDFDNRELFISLGCALENLCITALEKGYDYDVETKSLSINEEGAEVVRYIFDRYVAGAGSTMIARELNEQGITTIKGNDWTSSSVMGIINNEKYKGDILLGKTFTVDPISNRRI